MKNPTRVPNRYADSPFVGLTPTSKDERRFFVDFRIPNKFKIAKQYVVKEGDTLQLLAHKFYGFPELWFAIMDANHTILEHPQDLSGLVGYLINIPKVDTSAY